MRVLQIAGFSGSGKTRLIERLIPLLPVAACIKWTHHHLPEDNPGSDTARFGQLGVPQVLAAPDGILIRPTPQSRATLYEWLANTLADDQLVVVEGNKWHPAPKIWMGKDLPEDINPILVIGPQPPHQAEWYQTHTPATDSELDAAAEFLQKNWHRLTYSVSRSCP